MGGAVCAFLRLRSVAHVDMLCASLRDKSTSRAHNTYKPTSHANPHPNPHHTHLQLRLQHGVLLWDVHALHGRHGGARQQHTAAHLAAAARHGGAAAPSANWGARTAPRGGRCADGGSQATKCPGARTRGGRTQRHASGWPSHPACRPVHCPSAPQEAVAQEDYVTAAQIRDHPWMRIHGDIEMHK